MIVAAMGNEGIDNLHVGTTLQPGQTRYVRFTREKKGENGVYPNAELALWGQTSDRTVRFKVRPYVLTQGKLVAYDAAFWKRCADIRSGADRNNLKEHWSIVLRMNQIRVDVNDPSAEVVLAITLPGSERANAPSTSGPNATKGLSLPPLRRGMRPNTSPPPPITSWAKARPPFRRPSRWVVSLRARTIPTPSTPTRAATARTW